MVRPTMPVCSPPLNTPDPSRFECIHILTYGIKVVSANLTLSTLSQAINAVNPSVSYAFTNIDPTDDTNGGQPGGNIRTAYLFDPKVLRLRSSNPGTATSANEVLPGPTLKYNPGLIDPLNPAWTSSRKPLVAQWETLDGSASFITVNVHFASKGGSSSFHGDARPPVNGDVDVRLAQANITAVSAISLTLQSSYPQIPD
jgi:predicted extracellular nuclease